MTEPRQIAVIRSYDDLREGMRVLKERCGYSDLTLDKIAGLTDGHAGKLLIGTKIFGPATLGNILAGLGGVLILVEDPDLKDDSALGEHRIEHMVRRVRSVVRTANKARLARILNDPRYFKKLGRKGGKARVANQDANQRRRSAVRAARARWRRHRAAQAQEKQVSTTTP